jgi:hypothetical protein
LYILIISKFLLLKKKEWTVDCGHDFFVDGFKKL